VLAINRRDDIRYAAAAVPFLRSGGKQFEMVGQYELPDFPTPIVVASGGIWGRSKWTVSIPRDYRFPLSVKEYAGMGEKCREVAGRARDLHAETSAGEQILLHPLNELDPYFVDVQEAEAKYLLPVSGGPEGRRKHVHGPLIGEGSDPLQPQCEKTLTYVLESDDAALGNTLMMLWTFYSLAQEQDRSFFIDDTRWAYGQYKNLFQAPPSPNCRPPPRHEMIPCPVQARHLVVSAATAEDAMIGMLAGRKMDKAATLEVDGGHVGRGEQKALFDLARQGYEALFHPVTEDAAYMAKRVDELQSRVSSSSASHTDKILVGMHIRRGDGHPLEYQYRDSYIPLGVFLEHADRIVQERNSSTASRGNNQYPVNSAPADNTVPPTVHLAIATDDPTILDAPEMADVSHDPAQQRIKLAWKEHPHKARPDPHYMHRFMDEPFGWEGGFYQAMFWNLGKPIGKDRDIEGSPPARKEKAGEEKPQKKTAKSTDDVDEPPSEAVVNLRNYLARAYIMDLAVVARASDFVLCGVGSMGCRILGVMLGWDEVVGDRGKWVNIDGEYGWMGLGW